MEKNAKISDVQNSLEKEKKRLKEDKNAKIAKKKEILENLHKESAQVHSHLLINLKKLSEIDAYKAVANECIDENLAETKKQSLSYFKHLYHELSEVQTSYAAGLILSDSSAFKSLQVKKFSKESKQTNSATYILDEMKRKGDINRDQYKILIHRHEIYEQKYKSYVDRVAESGKEDLVDGLENDIKAEGLSLRTTFEKTPKAINNSEKRVELLAKIFALWSIVTAEVEGDEIDILYCPHAAQVISIFLLLCFDQPQGESIIASNRLAEIKTGEGKSISLAVISIYLSLFGYEVHCACYSEILSIRDEKEFRDLFHATKTEKNIKYGIFEKIIKEIINLKQEKTFSETIQELLEQKKESPWEKLKSWLSKFAESFSVLKGRNASKKILIIDEIDVLFDRSYYGNTYDLAVSLRHESIRRLLEFVWLHREDPQLNHKLVKNSKQFAKVVENYDSLETILENQINGMLAALKSFQDQHYYVVDRKIMYKGETTISDEFSYGYNTVFAYLKENDLGKVSEAALQENVCISLCVSEFSYACLPLYYGHVLGVSGTLKCLPDFVCDELRRYGIEKTSMFEVPSVYGDNNKRVINTPVYVEKDVHYDMIVENMKGEFEKERPILIFFRDKDELISFYSSPNFEPYQKFSTYITEEHS